MVDIAIKVDVPRCGYVGNPGRESLSGLPTSDKVLKQLLFVYSRNNLEHHPAALQSGGRYRQHGYPLSLADQTCKPLHQRIN